MPWPIGGLEKRCHRFIINFLPFCYTIITKLLPDFLQIKDCDFFMLIHFESLCNVTCWERKHLELPWRPLENYCIWKEERIHLFSTLFYVIIIAMPLNESLPVSKIFLQSYDQSHQRGKLKFPAELMNRTDMIHNLHNSGFRLVPVM